MTSRLLVLSIFLLASLTLHAAEQQSPTLNSQSNALQSIASTNAGTDSSSSFATGNNTPATVTVFDGASGKAIPQTFAGLSYELFTLIPKTNGVHYFRPDNKPLLNLFRTLGVGSLRVGGNLGDRDFRTPPTEADIDSFFSFAKKADVKVVYCLRLHKGDAVEQARIAKYIWDHYEPQLECFTIGQEPSAYPVEKVDTRRADQRMGEANEHYQYEDFATNWVRFDDEIRKGIPNVRIGGPSVYRKPDWQLRFINDFAKDGRISLVTAHLYPGGPGNKVVSTPEIGRDRMLSGEFESGYRSVSDNVIPVAASNNLGLRIEEANNYFNGGARNVSDTFAASLWGLDFLWWWASHGAAGINFHTGDVVAAGSVPTSAGYATFYSTPEGYHVQPLGYGIKAFELGARGRIVPVTVSPADSLKLSAYAALDSNTLNVTLINREHGAASFPIGVTLVVGNATGPAEGIALTAPGGDVAAQQGITIGGSGITPDGTWQGIWKPIPPAASGRFQIEVPPATALVLRIPVSGSGLTPPPFMTPHPRHAEDAFTPVDNARHEQFMKEIRESKGDVGITLVGDSITDFWPRTGIDSYIGFMPWKPLNLGVSGERTEQVLWRLLNGELEGYNAKVFMIMIGTNNLRFADEKPEWVASGIRKIVEEIRRKQPNAKILLLGVFPRGTSPDDPMRSRIAEVNKLIAPLADGKNVVYMDIGKNFLDAKGNLGRQIMPDYLHPNAEGYRIWFEAVKPTLDGFMK